MYNLSPKYGIRRRWGERSRLPYFSVFHVIITLVVSSPARLETKKGGGVAFKRSFFRSIRQDFSVAYMMYTENG